MTLFILWYAVWLKEKIKTVMRSLLVWVSVFIFYTTAHGTANAQLIYLQDSSIPPVLSYLNKFLDLQPKWSTSAAYSAWNKAFFEWFRNQIKNLPAEDHLRTVEYTLEQLEKMSTQKVKDTYNLDKNIAVAILNGIYDMAKNDIWAWSYTVYTNQQSETQSSQYTNKYSNSYFELEVKPYQGKTYNIYTLKWGISIKQADFHNAHGSFYHCMYEQCSKVAFDSAMDPTQVHMSFADWSANIKINLEENVSYTKETVQNEAQYNEETIIIQEGTSSSTTNEDISEDDLLKELSDLFWDIL